MDDRRCMTDDWQSQTLTLEHFVLRRAESESLTTKNFDIFNST